MRWNGDLTLSLNSLRLFRTNFKILIHNFLSLFSKSKQQHTHMLFYNIIGGAYKENNQKRSHHLNAFLSAKIDMRLCQRPSCRTGAPLVSSYVSPLLGQVSHVRQPDVLNQLPFRCYSISCPRGVTPHCGSMPCPSSPSFSATEYACSRSKY